MSELDPDELVLDFYLDPKLHNSGETMQVKLTPAKPPISKRQNAVGNVQVPLPEDIRKAYALKRTANRYNGMIHALEDLQKSIAKIETEALPNIPRDIVGIDIAKLDQLLSDFKVTRDEAQSQYNYYLDKCSDDEQ